MAISRVATMTMWVGLGVAHAAPPRLVPMTRADGEVCDLLRAQAKDRCQAVAQDGAATVYQSGSKQAGIRRLVIAIATGDDVLVSPPVDVVTERLDRTEPSLRQVTIDGRPGVELSVVSTTKPAARRESRILCSAIDGVWKCAQLDVASP